MMNKHLIVNSIITPDGMRLISRNRHDFKCHLDANNFIYCIDGGTTYLRRVCNGNVEIDGNPVGIDAGEVAPQYTENSVYDTDDWEIIRARFERGGRGIDGKQPLTYVPLMDMNDGWLQATIEYVCGNSTIPVNMMDRENKDYQPILALYQKELDYRQEKGIQVVETNIQ